jgi:predicted metal-dependent phosphoesterase TrpH
MKCDLHVHSYFSGMCPSFFLRHVCRESYSDPEALYSALLRRGMNLVTLTDHDSVEGASTLRNRPDFFLSEEVTCRMPSGTEVHIGVYDLSERQHEEVQRRRNDFISLLIYLTERRLFFSVNHVFSWLTGRRESEDFGWFEQYVPAMETRNGLLLSRNNSHAARLARRWRKIAIGGSDAHAMPSVGTAYTEVPGARNKQEFFAGLRLGKGRVKGHPGNYSKLTRDVLLIGREMMREKTWKTTLAPLALLVPAFTFANWCGERAFARRWSARMLRGHRRSKRPAFWQAKFPAMQEGA